MRTETSTTHTRKSIMQRTMSTTFITDPNIESQPHRPAEMLRILWKARWVTLDIASQTLLILTTLPIINQCASLSPSHPAVHSVNKRRTLMLICRRQLRRARKRRRSDNRKSSRRRRSSRHSSSRSSRNWPRSRLQRSKTRTRSTTSTTSPLALTMGSKSMTPTWQEEHRNNLWCSNRRVGLALMKLDHRTRMDGMTSTLMYPPTQTHRNRKSNLNNHNSWVRHNNRAQPRIKLKILISCWEAVQVISLNRRMLWTFSHQMTSSSATRPIPRPRTSSKWVTSLASAVE